MENRILYFSFLWVIFSSKIIVITLNFFNVDLVSFGGGSDANYYHNFAIGLSDIALNYWPVFLRELNGIGLYNREVISVILSFFSIFVIPFILYKIVQDMDVSLFRKYYNSCIVWFMVYPSIFFFSLDIVRDVAMLLIFSLVIYCVYFYIESKSVYKFVILILAGFFTYLLLDLRLYLAVSIILAFFSYDYVRRLSSFYFLGVGYIFLCFIFSYLGLFNSLIDYRGGFDADSGGTTLGLNLETANPVYFIFNFILSYIFQFFGLYFSNVSSVFVFVFESLFVIFSMTILIKERKYIDGFVAFLVCFVIIYNTVWVIGNDNLGTAVRLRIYSYISIVLASLCTLNNKYRS